MIYIGGWHLYRRCLSIKVVPQCKCCLLSCQFCLQILPRVRQPNKQIRKGLKERKSGRFFQIGQMSTPRESNEELNPKTVIQNIHWPQPKSDSDEDDPVMLEKVGLVTGI